MCSDGRPDPGDRMSLSHAGVPVEGISPLVGHSGTTVTELVYRHQLNPVIQTGATVIIHRHADPITSSRPIKWMVIDL